MDTVSGSHSCYNGRITFTYVDGTFGRGLRADVVDQHTWLMLSDQCPWHFRIESSVDGIIKVTRGSMIKQIDDCLSTLDRMNPRMCNDRQPGRFRRFPKAALEETVLNAVIHRDYDIQDDTVITLHPDSLDFESPGTLWFPDRWNIRIWSEPRNLEIANILMRLDQVTLNGNGFINIRNSYRKTGCVPRIVAKESSFLVQLPAIENTGDSIALKRDKILRYLSDHHGASVKEVAELTMTSLNHSKRILQTMVENNEVFFTGVDADRRYFITDRDTT